jgi:hypothetical protein
MEGAGCRRFLAQDAARRNAASGSYRVIDTHWNRDVFDSPSSHHCGGFRVRSCLRPNQFGNG